MFVEVVFVSIFDPMDNSEIWKDFVEQFMSGVCFCAFVFVFTFVFALHAWPTVLGFHSIKTGNIYQFPVKPLPNCKKTVSRLNFKF